MLYPGSALQDGLRRSIDEYEAQAELTTAHGLSGQRGQALGVESGGRSTYRQHQFAFLHHLLEGLILLLFPQANERVHFLGNPRIRAPIALGVVLPLGIQMRVTLMETTKEEGSIEKLWLLLGREHVYTTVCICRSEDNLQEPVHSFHHVGPRD